MNKLPFLSAASQSSFFLLLMTCCFACSIRHHGVKASAVEHDKSAKSAQQHFVPQALGAPFYGQHVSVAHADLNNDGHQDLLFAAGRHWIDQPFALINLGVVDGSSSSSSSEKTIRFSQPVKIGDPGGYYAVDAVRLSTLPSTHWGVLLAGGTCQLTEPNSYGTCGEYGANTPAVLLDVSVTGCSVSAPDVPCEATYKMVWNDPNPEGDRNGGFAPTLSGGGGNGGDGVGYSVDGGGDANGDPAIVLVGQGGVAIFVPDDDGAYSTDDATFRHAAPDNGERRDSRSDKSRYAGFASGIVGTDPGFVAGCRSDYDRPPNPDLVVRRSGGTFAENQSVDDGDKDEGDAMIETASLGGEPYAGNPSYALQTTGVVLADFDGDGIDDLAEATFLYNDQIVTGHPLPQRVYLLDGQGHPKAPTLTLYNAPRGGRSVAVGQIFHESPLPDVAFATAGGTVVLFANLGVDDSDGSTFLGFEQRHELRTGQEGCEVRKVDVVSLAPCSVSIVCAVACAYDDPASRISGMNYAFHRYDDACARVEPGALDLSTESVGVVV